MTIKEIDNFFISLQRPTENGITLLYTRQGAAGIERPFVVIESPDDINAPAPIIARFRSVYEVMDYSKHIYRATPKQAIFTHNHHARAADG